MKGVYDRERQQDSMQERNYPIAIAQLPRANNQVKERRQRKTSDINQSDVTRLERQWRSPTSVIRLVGRLRRWFCAAFCSGEIFPKDIERDKDERCRRNH